MEEEKLIMAIKNRPILYDKSIKDYRKLNAREDAWKEVSTELNLKDDECKKRWRSLRDAFIKYHRSRKTARRGSVGAKKKVWVYYPQMSFMIPRIQIKEEGNCENNGTEQDSEDYEDPLVTSREMICSQTLPTHILPSNNDNKISLKKTSTNGFGTTKRTKKGKCETEDDKITDVIAKKKEHPDEQFLLSYAPVLKRLTPRGNALARMKIQQVLYEVEFGEDSSRPATYTLRSLNTNSGIQPK